MSDTLRSARVTLEWSGTSDEIAEMTCADISAMFVIAELRNGAAVIAELRNGAAAARRSF